MEEPQNTQEGTPSRAWWLPASIGEPVSEMRARPFHVFIVDYYATLFEWAKLYWNELRKFLFYACAFILYCYIHIWLVYYEILDDEAWPLPTSTEELFGKVFSLACGFFLVMPCIIYFAHCHDVTSTERPYNAGPNEPDFLYDEDLDESIQQVIIDDDVGPGVTPTTRNEEQLRSWRESRVYRGPFNDLDLQNAVLRSLSSTDGQSHSTTPPAHQNTPENAWSSSTGVNYMRFNGPSQAVQYVPPEGNESSESPSPSPSVRHVLRVSVDRQVNNTVTMSPFGQLPVITNEPSTPTPRMEVNQLNEAERLISITPTPIRSENTRLLMSTFIDSLEDVEYDGDGELE